jgi:DNA-binding NarL/FixJ family response regulator
MAKAGRKSKAEEMGLKALLDKYVSPAARARVLARLLFIANDKREPRTGLEAIRLLMAYLYGSPKQSVELSGNKDKPLVIQAFNYGAAVAALAAGAGACLLAGLRCARRGDGREAGV